MYPAKSGSVFGFHASVTDVVDWGACEVEVDGGAGDVAVDGVVCEVTVDGGAGEVAVDVDAPAFGVPLSPPPHHRYRKQLRLPW